ncbi:Uncharacterized protein Fot_54553 [Forsythia ovata]|uniref:Uncharacterized protein n=1 Tax=Forsythia ovata TaxID=205694 RepID=A0ABD1P827_9LAMI
MSGIEGPHGGKTPTFLDWFDAQLDPMESDMQSPLDSRNKEKLVPKRGIEGRTSQPQDTNSVYHFMPTPGVDLQGQREGPSASSLLVARGHDKGKSVMEEIDISTMVEDLERLNAEEAAITRDAKAHAKSQINTRSSRFVPPRAR